MGLIEDFATTGVAYKVAMQIRRTLRQCQRTKRTAAMASHPKTKLTTTKL